MLDEMSDAIQQIVLNSDKLISWCLSVVGGSLLALLGSEYTSPRSTFLRIIYFLYIPGWIFLGLSITDGINISNRSIIWLLKSSDSKLRFDILSKINQDYCSQIVHFKVGLLFFGLWLITYLFWWIFSKELIKNKISR